MRHQISHQGAEDALLAGQLEEEWGRALPRGLRRRRTSRRSGGGGASADHKTLQLCHQVAVTLDEVLAECGDPLLQGLRVLNVQPAPDASRLAVTLAVDGEPVEALATIEEHLARASGHLRAEVAGAITRKRAPSLAYILAPGETGA